jgi:hypothetical protein
MPTLDFLNPDLYPDSDEDDDDDDDQETVPPPRAASPSPSARTFSSTIRRRFSILNFQRKPTRPEAAPFREPSPPTLSRGSTVPSTSSSAPQTPTEEAFPPPPRTGAKGDCDPDPDLTIGEMRLDSLHFDSLSFDPDNF